MTCGQCSHRPQVLVFLACMVYHRSGNASLPCFKSLWWHHLLPYSTTKFHITIGGAILSHIRYPLFLSSNKQPLQFPPGSDFSLEDLLAHFMMGVNFVLDFGHNNINLLCHTPGADAAEQPTFTSITSFRRLFRNNTKSIWVPVCNRWLSRFLKLVLPRNRSYAIVHIPGCSKSHYQGLASHTYSLLVLLCNRSLYCLRGHSSHHMGWGIAMLVYVFHTDSIAFNRLNCSPDKVAYPRTICANFYLNGPFDFRLYDGSDLKTYLLMRW